MLLPFGKVLILRRKKLRKEVSVGPRASLSQLLLVFMPLPSGQLLYLTALTSDTCSVLSLSALAAINDNRISCCSLMPKCWAQC